MADARLERPRSLCLQLVQLHARYCGKPFRSSGESDDWAVVGPALLARASYGLESVLALADREIDAALVVRAVYEAGTLFAWIAISPSQNTASWWREDIRQRLAAARELNALGAIVGGLDQQVASLEAEFQRLKQQSPWPALPELAAQADEYWVQRLPGLLQDGRTSFRGTYSFLYRFASQSAHGFSLPLRAFVHSTRPGISAIGRPIPSGPPMTAFAPYAFANALAVASVALGWPHASEIDEIFANTPRLEQ